MERCVDLIGRLRQGLRERGWRIANEEGTLAVLCVEPPPGSAMSISTLAARVLASGRAWVATGAFEGSKVLRICLTHGEARLADVQELIAALEAARGAAA